MVMKWKYNLETLETLETDWCILTLFWIENNGGFEEQVLTFPKEESSMSFSDKVKYLTQEVIDLKKRIAQIESSSKLC